MAIYENLHSIREKISLAALKAGRNETDVTLVAVSKTQNPEKLIEAKQYGLTLFGENKAQELLEKYPVVKDVTWHFIGHLQKNKVKYIIDKVEMIHSLDSIELAEEIDKRAMVIGKVMPVLIQINIGKEESKSGIYEEEVEDFIQKALQYKNIKISGLMAIPPAGGDKEQARKYFRKMNEIYLSLKKYDCSGLNMKFLSMGMTNDFETAIEEGANIIRVGTGIFGNRDYSKGV